MKLSELFKEELSDCTNAAIKQYGSNEQSFQLLYSTLRAGIDIYGPTVAMAFGDWLRGLRPDVYHGSPTTEVLFNQFLSQYNPSV